MFCRSITMLRTHILQEGGVSVVLCAADSTVEPLVYRNGISQVIDA